MKSNRPDRVELVAKILRWLMGVTLALVAGYYIWATTQNTAYRYVNAAVLPEQKRILFTAFDHRPEKIVEELGMPAEVVEIRIDEKLMYWNLDLVTFQVHLHKGAVSRMAYYVDDDSIRDDLVSEIVELNGGEKDWTLIRNKSSDSAVEIMVNAKLGRTIEKDDDSIFFYGYVKK